MHFRKVFLSALAVLGLMGAGCGGCDSCFSNHAGDDASIPTAPPRPTTVDASVARDPEEDAGPKEKPKDAGSDAMPALPPTALASAVPRPKSSLPTGAFQSCGVYEGPLCERKCPKGACRQECDGVKCALSCAGGYCSQLCGASGECTLSCPGGHCVQVCARPDGCTKDCAGGGCE